jgi:hypothetical protein
MSLWPYFWNEIEIQSQYHNGDQDFVHIMQMLSFFLDAVRGAPFSFTFYMVENTGEDRSLAPDILWRLSKHSEQWENVSMRLQESEFILLHKVRNRLQTLQKLELILFDDISDGLLPGDVFAGAPLLTHIELRCFSDAVRRFNWKLLTSIHLHSTRNPEMIISALRQTINLEKLVIDENFYSDSKDIGIIHLPSLTYLSVQGVALLTVLETPVLKSLEISFQYNYNIYFTELALEETRRTISFILRSKCVLSTFSAKRIESTALKEILSYMPDIEELSLLDVRCMAKLFEWLSGPEPSVNALRPREPRLQCLNKLTVYPSKSDNDAHDDLEALQDMISRRAIGTSVLGPKVLHMKTSNILNNSVSDRLESLCRDMGVLFLNNK